jgi:hypothetical protein
MPDMEGPFSLSLNELREWLEMNLLRVGCSVALVGILPHVIIFRTSFPTEGYLYTLLSLYTVTVLSLTYSYFSITECLPLQGLARVGLITVSYNIGPAASI